MKFVARVQSEGLRALLKGEQLVAGQAEVF